MASSDVNPANDPDNDGVANLLEILTGTDPLDSTKYKIMLLPTPVYINNTNDVVVKLSGERFYEDLPKEDSIILSLPAGTLTNGRQAILMDINNTAVDFNGTSISNFSLPTGYSQVSRFFSLDPANFGSNKNMTITIPFRKNDYIAANNYSFLYHIAGTPNWNLGSTTVRDISDSTVSITGTIQSPDAIVIVSKENASIVGYLDGAVITSDKTSEASISLDLEIKDISQNDTARAYITYSDYSSGSNPINTSFSVRFDNFQNEDGTYKLVANTGSAPHKSNNRMVVSEIRITGAGVNYDYVVSSNNAVERGQNLLLSAHTQADNYNRSTSTVAWTFSNNFNIESIDLDGEGRIRTVGDSLSYDYYVKDHLGSTREVINDEGRVTEATMYYPYGTMVSLLKPPTGDNAREKFTGKELDAGDIPGNEVTYEFSIDNFDAGNRSYGCNLYVNYTDLSTNRNLTRVYPLTYHRSSLKYTLNAYERFSDSIKITHLNIATYNSPINFQYEKDCNYIIKENGGIKIALNVNAQALIDNSSQDYFVSSSYETVRVVGSNLYYFGARYYDPELGIWTSTDPNGQFFNPYSYSTNPLNFIDPTGEEFLSAAIAGAIIAAAVTTATVTTTALQQDWHFDQWFYNLIWQTNISGAAGFVSGGVGSVISDGVAGAVGITSGSGFLGSSVGGISSGAFSGTVGYLGYYGAQSVTGMQEWDNRQFWKGLGISTLSGGILGGAKGVLEYGLNPNGVRQNIIKWGYEHEKYQGAIDFVSKEYNLSNGMLYTSKPITTSDGRYIGGITISNNESYISKDAFLLNGKFDASKLVQTVHHETFMQTHGIFPVKSAPNGFTNVIETGAFARDFASSYTLGLSQAVRDWTWQAYRCWFNVTPSLW